MTEQTSRFIDAIKGSLPESTVENWPAFLSDELVACQPVDLPESLWREASGAIRDFHTARSQDLAKSTAWPPPGNASICMSYDFHWDPNSGLRLIEINTNAAFLFLSLPLYKSFGLSPKANFTEQTLKSMIENEVSLFSKGLGTVKSDAIRSAAIVDENPREQKLFSEFLYTKALFEKWGWKTEILDVSEVREGFDFIYNRSTDFQFRQPQSEKLLDLYTHHKTCISPHPLEYLLLADKERLTQWSQDSSELGPAAKKVLLKSQVLTDGNRDQMWSERKRLFFKPLRSFGGKMSYRGESMSRKAFEQLPSGQTLAQEYCAAPTLKTAFGEFKYDLRFYAYEDQLQTVIARLYQGQLTNLKTLGGGFAPIRWES